MEEVARYGENGRVEHTKEFKPHGLLHSWWKGSTGRGLLMMIDIFNYCFDDESVLDIAIIDYESWPIKVLKPKLDEDKGSEGVANIWKDYEITDDRNEYLDE